jgi:hypothetical protein
MVVIFLLACVGEAPVAADAAPAELSAVEWLNRASVDVRGRRPTEAEIAAVEADPAALPELFDAFVTDPAFALRLIPLYNEIFRTKTDHFLVSLDNDVAFLDPDYALAFRHSVGEEPERLVWYIAENDLPWTDIVLADYTLADDRMFEHLPLTDLDGGQGWRRARYVDDRPVGGMLVTNGMWWRYTSTFENANRGRAQAVARSLLCDDRFEAAVSFAGATASLDERTQSDPTCVSCHASLDPLAAYFWGFMLRNQEAWLEAIQYNAAFESGWEQETGIGPGYYGAPGVSLAGLGAQIAADPRFVNCAVETGMRLFVGDTFNTESAPDFGTHREAFLAGGLTLRSLYRSLLDDPRYRQAERDDDPATAPRLMRVDQRVSAIEALTGYRWAWQGNDMLDVDDGGVRVLAGGVDGLIATEPSVEPSTTSVLVQERLAEAAAQYAVVQEAERVAAERTLFREIDLDDDAPADTALDAQIVALLLSAHGRRHAADDEEVQSLAQLWRELVEAGGAPREAWADLLSGILRHPDFVTY